MMVLPLRPLQAQRGAQDTQHLIDPIHAPGCRHSGRPLGPCTLHPRLSAHLGSRPSHRHSHTRSVLARESYQPEPEPEPATPTVFERRGERDVYRRLGISRDADFEEVVDAHSWLHAAYKSHAPSRESIEMAYDTIIKEKYQDRQKHGFRPPKTGRRADVAARPRLTIAEQIKSRLEPAVAPNTLVNEGSIYLAMGIWAAVQSATADPTLPIVFSFGYSVYSLVRKRKLRNPEGPFLGDNPLWGSLASSLAALGISGVVLSTLLPRLPMPANIPVEAVTLFLINACVGAITIFVR